MVSPTGGMRHKVQAVTTYGIWVGLVGVGLSAGMAGGQAATEVPSMVSR